LSDSQNNSLEQIFRLLVKSALAQPAVYVHRDYMPRNLMLSDPNPGVLDFQDAVLGPITYDMVSLLRDAFVSWDEERVLDWSARYWEKAKRAGLPVETDFAQFWRAFEWMGLQRHLKVPRHLRAHQLSRRQAEISRGYAALHRLCARSVRALRRARPARQAARRARMKAMILAAGRGERLRPLTDAVPKALVEAGGKPLIAWHLERLARSGCREAVINVSHLAERIVERVGDGARYGLRIAYSREPQPLETAGGLARRVRCSAMRRSCWSIPMSIAKWTSKNC